MRQAIHLIGFGSQGTAWAECLRASGWDVSVYLHRREGTSFERATTSGFRPQSIQELPDRLERKAGEAALIAMLCTDERIGPLYREFIAPVHAPVTLVLAHGYAVYAEDLVRLAPGHEVALLAPKAIGPKLLAAHHAARPGPHNLVAAIHSPENRRPALLRLALALGFRETNLIEATFEQETVGDLISEQSLLCGGLFALLEWTMETMSESGVPDRLIREECLTELELIAGLLRERGPASTYRAISQAAQCGTTVMRSRLDQLGVREAVRTQAGEVRSRHFAAEMRRGEWREKASELAARLEGWEDRLFRKGERS